MSLSPRQRVATPFINCFRGKSDDTEASELFLIGEFVHSSKFVNEKN